MTVGHCADLERGDGWRMVFRVSEARKREDTIHIMHGAIGAAAVRKIP
jgi:hypothetical protein